MNDMMNTRRISVDDNPLIGTQERIECKPWSWKDRFEANGADGIDFVDFNFKINQIGSGRIYRSYTKEEFLRGVTYPRSNYYFWKLVNGHKQYIINEQHNDTPTAHPAKIETVDVDDHVADTNVYAHVKTITEQFDVLNADGIDFVDFGFDNNAPDDSKIYLSCTKDIFMMLNSYPKSHYIFWKLVDGKKKYLIENE